MSRYESIYPPKIKKGDCIGIAAPSSPFDPDEFERGLRCIESMGFNPVVPDQIRETKRFLAGSDELRASVIHDLFADSRIKAVLCARGGYGSMRLLGRMDGDLIRDNPKIFMGFSDATALLNHLYQAWGLVTYHGPMVCSLGRSDQDSLDAMAQVLSDGAGSEMQADKDWVLIPGQAEGHLMGGNLATLCHLVGTPYQPDFQGAILMLEDVGEPPYKIDRMLMQMKYAGLFDGVSGVVLGAFEDSGDKDQLADIFLEVFSDSGIPLAMNFCFGHGVANRAFPIGVSARLDTDALRLVF